MFLEKYYKFQFHYGTIKRRKTSVISRAVMAYFNSTMVRLKGSKIATIHVRYAFQFHYGTIKRLKENLNKRRKQKFQFHYGTIKRKSGEDPKSN